MLVGKGKDKGGNLRICLVAKSVFDARGFNATTVGGGNDLLRIDAAEQTLVAGLWCL